MAEINNQQAAQSKALDLLSKAGTIQAQTMLKLSDRYKMKLQKETFDVKKGESLSITLNTSVQFSRVLGVCIDSDDKEALENSTMSLEIDSNEIFPPKTRCNMFSRKNNLNFYDNMYVVNERANNSTVKLEYQDGGASRDYQVTLYMWCSMVK